MDQIQTQLRQIVERLKKEETRWDAILQLKIIEDPKWIDPMINLLSDQDWVIRWCIAEKLGDLRDIRAVKPLIKTLRDNDYHVRKNAIKALIKYGASAVPTLLPYFAHQDPDIRTQVMTIIVNLGQPILPVLEKCLPDQDWIAANRIIDVIWRLGGPQAEDILIRSLNNVKVQKHATVLLGVMQSRKSIPYLVQGFSNPRIKRLVLYALYRIGEKQAYPFIVQSVNSKNQGISKLAQKIVVKVGVPMLPYLVKDLLNPDVDKMLALQLISKIGPIKVKTQLKIVMEKDPLLKPMILKVMGAV